MIGRDVATDTLVLDLAGAAIPIRLLTSEAPETCRQIVNHALLRGEAIHDIWSGRIIFMPLPPRVHIPIENPTMYVVPGDIFFYERPERLEHGRPYGFLSLAEIGIVYGRDSQPRGPRGPKVVNLFGRVDDSLDVLANICDRMIREGSAHVNLHA